MPDPTFKQSTDEVTWGRVIAFCLRQPDLAARVGLCSIGSRFRWEIPNISRTADGFTSIYSTRRIWHRCSGRA